MHFTNYFINHTFEIDRARAASGWFTGSGVFLSAWYEVAPNRTSSFLEDCK